MVPRRLGQRRGETLVWIMFIQLNKTIYTPEQSANSVCGSRIELRSPVRSQLQEHCEVVTHASDLIGAVYNHSTDG